MTFPEFPGISWRRQKRRERERESERENSLVSFTQQVLRSRCFTTLTGERTLSGKEPETYENKREHSPRSPRAQMKRLDKHSLTSLPVWNSHNYSVIFSSLSFLMVEPHKSKSFCWRKASLLLTDSLLSLLSLLFSLYSLSLFSCSQLYRAKAKALEKTKEEEGEGKKGEEKK